MNSTTNTNTPATMEKKKEKKMPKQVTFTKVVTFTHVLTYDDFCEEHEGMPEEDLKRAWRVLCEREKNGDYDEDYDDEDDDGNWTNYEGHVEDAWREADQRKKDEEKEWDRKFADDWIAKWQKGQAEEAQAAQ